MNNTIPDFLDWRTFFTLFLIFFEIFLTFVPSVKITSTVWTDFPSVYLWINFSELVTVVPSPSLHSILSYVPILLLINTNLFPIDKYSNSGFNTLATFIVILFVALKPLCWTFTFEKNSQDFLNVVVISGVVVFFS